MATGLENVVANIRRMAGLPKARGLNDRQLLGQFAAGDEAAFSVLVDRYAGLVMGVCRRVLQHTQDAEDAFQATFMVLARKAGKVAWQESVANWLHGVAYRIACKIRGEKARRAARERAAKPATASADPAWSDLKPLLDEELNRLPARYRMPLILCCLEGKTRDEAAAQLGWSSGSVKGRLERGREILRTRLARRGLALSAVLSATLFTTGAARAAVPLTLTLDTVRAGMSMLAGQTAGVVSSQVLSLAQGALHAMFMTKVKIAAAVFLTLSGLGLGTGYVAHQALADDASARENTVVVAQPQQNQTDDNSRNEVLDPSELSFTLEQREGERGATRINGIVKAVDADKNTINVLTSRENPEGTTYEVAKDVKVVIRERRDTKDAKLSDIKPRARVILLLDDAKKTVKAIEIQGAVEGGGERRPDGGIVVGVLKAVDADKKTITLQTGGRDPNAAKETTYELAKEFKVVIRQGRTITKEVKLADLELNKPVQVRLDETKKLVQTIEVHISTQVSGLLSEVDHNKKTITVQIGGGREVEGKKETFDLAKDFKVFVNEGQRRGDGGPPGREVKLADVPVTTTPVTVQLDDAKKVAQFMQVNAPTMQTTLKAVDAAKGIITVSNRREDKDLAVAKNATITINGKAGKLADLTAGADAIIILSLDRTQIVGIVTPPPERGREEE